VQRVLVWLVSVLLILSGCDEGPAAIDGSSDAVIEGVVLRASGSPVTSAAVSVFVVDSAGGETVFDEPRGITDATGHFSMHLAAFLTAPFTGRVQVTVRPQTAEPNDTTVDVGFVRFGRQPPDTSNTTIIYP
jgi:hypothetical protein